MSRPTVHIRSLPFHRGYWGRLPPPPRIVINAVFNKVCVIVYVWQTKKRFAKEWAEAEKASQHAEKIEHDLNATKLDVEKVKTHTHTQKKLVSVSASEAHPSAVSLTARPRCRPSTMPTTACTRRRRAGTTTQPSCRSTTRSRTTSTTQRRRRSST